MPTLPSTDDFEVQCKAACPHCAAGVKVRQRADTKEWVHDFARNLDGGGRWHGHTICGAHAPREQREKN